MQMKNLKNGPRGLVPAIFVLSCAMIFGADWRPVNSGLPVTIAGVGALTVDPKTPSTVYTTANGRVFKTTDSGASWTPISTVTAVRSLILAPANPSTLYAVTGHGVVKSRDGGETWTNAGLPEGGNYSLVIDPRTPSTLYAQTFRTLLKSTDGAETWNQVVTNVYTSLDATIPLVNAHFPSNSIVIDPKNSSTMYATLAGLFKSTDGGSTWYPATNLPTKVQLSAQAFPVFDPVNPSTMYVGYNDSDPVTQVRTAYLLKSTDDGASWNTIGDGFPANSWVWALAIDPTTPSAVYASYVGVNGWGVSKSTDGGQTFNKLAASLPLNLTGSVLAISPTSPSTVYAAYADFSIHRERLLKSKDGGASWDAADGGLTFIDVRALAIDPANASTVYAGIGGDGAGVFKSVDGGAHWSSLAQFQISGTPGFLASPQPQSEPGSVNSLLISLVSPNTLYASTGRISGSCIYTDRRFFKSTDGGVSWSDGVSLPSGCGFFGSPLVMVLEPTDSDDLYLGDGGDCGGAFLYNSPDAGLDWKFLGSGFADYLYALVIDPANAATLYAATEAGVLKSTNGGVAWTKTGLSMQVNVLAIDRANPGTLYAATGGLYGNSGFHGMFKSIDGGANWAPINNGLASVIDTRSPVTALAIAPDHAIYASTSGHGVYKSNDGGASWASFNTGLTNLDVRVLSVSATAPNTLYAVTPGGTFTVIDEVK